MTCKRQPLLRVSDYLSFCGLSYWLTDWLRVKDRPKAQGQRYTNTDMEKGMKEFKGLQSGVSKSGSPKGLQFACSAENGDFCSIQNLLTQ